MLNFGIDTQLFKKCHKHKIAFLNATNNLLQIGTGCNGSIVPARFSGFTTIDMCRAVILSSASAERRILNIIHGRCSFGRDCFTLPLAGSRDRSQ